MKKKTPLLGESVAVTDYNMLREGKLNYKEAAKILKSAAALGSRPGLESISKLCACLGNPHKSMKFIHVAGTNGKGSVCQMLASVFKFANYKTGLYISPHIDDYRETILINGKEISKHDFCSVVSVVDIQVKKLKLEGVLVTEFEFLTACALYWFFQSRCDIVVLETGMGGRLDATNIVQNDLVNIITAISLDHTAFLGDSIVSIAREKCGIIKNNSLTVSYPDQQQDVFEIIKMHTKEKRSDLLIPDMKQLQIISRDLKGTHMRYREIDIHVRQLGMHQVLNALVVIEAAKALHNNGEFFLPDDVIACGIENANIPARQEVYSENPLVVLDGAHNLQGIMALADTVKMNIKQRPIVVLMGMLKDKQYRQSIAIMAKLCDKFIAVTPISKRALENTIAAQIAGEYCKEVIALDDISEAVKDAKAFCSNGGAIVVCGSFYLSIPLHKILGRQK